MSDFQYFFGNDYQSYFDLPHDDEFGFAESDSVVLDAAWEAMKASCVVVRVTGDTDTDRLLKAGALLIRQRNFDASKLGRQEIEVIMKKVIHEPQEAMFHDDATAQVAALMFNGLVSRN